MPSSSAAAAISPAPSGGVQTTIRRTPATCAGTTHITSVEIEVARHVDADRVERHPAALEHHAGLDLERDVGGALRLVPAAHAVGERQERLARQLRRLGDGARGLDAVELERPLAHGLEARAP